MSRIPTPASIADAPAASQELLTAVQKELGSVPNLFRIVATSPVALEGFLGLNGALGRSEISSATRERISLALAETNGCDYCLAAHTYLGRNLAKLTDAEIQANRKGSSTDAKADAAVRFALSITEKRGHVAADELNAFRAAGYSDAAIVEIIALVAVNVFTNYTNSVLDTEVDFPVAEELAV
ncbi:carboxymuconolactone decarboxylase family protein [Ponticaulis sp.]|uniref:carboxymuconolactone decarboxylase family protein n=1 Tax=Ponticaulis sp. TaxID=2020902 RepID=UPI000C6B2362|nr:carboxymuconolactone decarboxylase family protein [Ponticaulis sp.]MBN03392.1 alkylhydroperoxidase [Ponticaulis sp.]|tara:strand:+ start:298 stop:846 length:549 start_codon:yes stop_codon:yes gene_type:complete